MASLKGEGGKLDEILKSEGVRGIELYPYNYKEVLSRRILQPGGEAASSNREDELWRMLLTENVSSGDGGVELPGDLPIPPEMIRRILARLGDALHGLPVEQKSTVLQSLDAGAVDAVVGADGDGGLANAADSRKPAIASVLGEMDFAHMIGLYLSPAGSMLEKGRIEEILVSFPTGFSYGTCASSSDGSATRPWFPTWSGCSTTRTSG